MDPDQQLIIQFVRASVLAENVQGISDTHGDSSTSNRHKPPTLKRQHSFQQHTELLHAPFRFEIPSITYP
jgi:hypothetical protein